MDARRGYAAWIPVESSNVAAILWFARPRGMREEGVLAVRLKGSGMVYHYPGVREDVFKAMLSAPSKGKFLAHAIKPKYRHEGPMAA
jgi:hypothetical protein